MKKLMLRIMPLMFTAIFINGCEQREIVASVGKEKITAEELMATLTHAGLPATEHNLDLLLGQLITQRAAEHQLNNLKLDDNLDYQRRVRQLALEVLRKRYKQEAEEEVDMNITEEDIRSYYEQVKKRFFHSAKVRVALIAFENHGEEALEAVSDRLRNLQGLIGDKRDMEFQQLAAKYSLHRASRYLGGDIGYLEQGMHSRWPKDLVDAAFVLEQKGDLSSVVVTSDKLYLVKLIDRQPAYTEPFNAVRENLRQELLTQKYDDINTRIRAKLMAGMPVERNEELLASLSVRDENPRKNTVPGPALN